MNSSSKTLFIGHDASRTGAPILLLHLLRWLRRHSALDLDLMLLRGGPLEPEFLATVPGLTHYESLLPKPPRTLFRRALRKAGLRRESAPDLNRLFPVESHPLVYANTIASLEAARSLATPGRKCILHVHELGYVVRYFRTETLLRESVTFVTRYIAASQAVADFLTGEMAIPADRISVVHEHPVSYLSSPEERAAARKRVRSLWGATDSTPVIGMCGTMDWRKGIDLFVQLAAHLKRRSDHRYLLVWVGGDPAHAQITHDLRQMGLEGMIRILPPCPDPETCFPAMDLFALTSREDPFPVAMLEAAASGLPIVAFQGGGGAPELVEQDAGKIVPYADVGAMAEAVASLTGDPEAQKRAGVAAATKVLERFHPDRQMARILEVIHSVQKENRP